jgi:hypothetical protein
MTIRRFMDVDDYPWWEEGPIDLIQSPTSLDQLVVRLRNTVSLSTSAGGAFGSSGSRGKRLASQCKYAVALVGPGGAPSSRPR